MTLIKLAGTTTALMLVLGVATAQAGDVRDGAEAMTDGAAQRSGPPKAPVKARWMPARAPSKASAAWPKARPK
jgi:hypothetical protein